MSNQSSGPMIYRDSKGRVRTERHADPTANGRPAPPDDFVIAEINDPVAGFEYVLDPVNQIAHRRPFKPGSSWKWDPSQITNMPTQPHGPDGPNTTVQFLGTQSISGVLAYGQKTTWTRTTRGGEVISQTEEQWFDPASGERLSSISGRNGSPDTSTMTLANYSNAEPEPSLFQIADGYQTVDETSPTFQVVHQNPGPGSRSSGMHGPQLTSQSCDQGVCNVTYDPGNPPTNAAVTSAPYSGHETLTSVANNQPPFTGMPHGRYRDSWGRVRTDPARFSGGAPGGALGTMLPLVEIDDAVAGYVYILSPASQTAYRIKAAFRSFAFQPNQNMAQQAGTRTTPNGSTVTNENLGPETVSGVTATGQRTTTIYPPGTYNQNDKEIVTVNERWIDPKTGVVILTKNTGLTGNIATNSIPDYQEGDPDPSLFQIPAGYKIVDETGTFTFTAPAP
jgi:hypothetical protein